MNASLNEILRDVEWGEYRIGCLFDKIKTKKLPYKAEELPKQATGKYILPCLTSSFRNQGLNYYVPEEGATILKNVISIPSNSDVYRAYYHPTEFTVLSDAYAIRWKSDTVRLSENQYLFMAICINKVTDLPIYSYKNKLGGWNVVQNMYIQLPQKNGSIDFTFMESFIAKLQEERMAELEDYLLVTGLSNYEMTNTEEDLLNGSWKWKEYEVNKLFDISKTSGFDSDRLVEGEKYDYVTRTSLNQGVLQSTGLVEDAIANDAGTWSLGLLQMDF